MEDKQFEGLPPELKKVLKVVKEKPEYYPYILTLISNDMEKYKTDCKKRNDWVLREALGDAVHLLGMKKKPPFEEMKKLCIRIKNAIFPNGITSYHHQGEKNFYEKYLK